MNFPEDYPVSPPQVRITPAIPHPNVFGESYICLDMLKRMSSTQPYTGWTTAYSVQSILLQLQAFLFAENIPQEYGGTLEAYNDEELVSRARAAMARSRCSCGHTSAEPYPPLPEKVSGPLINLIFTLPTQLTSLCTGYVRRCHSGIETR